MEANARNCSLCVKPLGNKSSYERIKDAEITHRKYLHLFTELGYNIRDLDYLCRQCNTALQKRVKIETEYEQRQSIISHLKNRANQDPILPSTPPVYFTVTHAATGGSTTPQKPVGFATPKSARKLQCKKTVSSPVAFGHPKRATPKSSRKLQFGGVKRTVPSPAARKPRKKFRPILPWPQQEVSAQGAQDLSFTIPT